MNWFRSLRARILLALTPSQSAWHGAALGTFLITLALLAYLATGVIEPGRWTWLPAAIYIAIPLLLALIVGLLFPIAALMGKMPRLFRFALLWSLALWALALLLGPGALEGIWLPLYACAASILLGGGAWAWLSSRHRAERNRMAAAAAVIGFAALDALLIYVLLPSDTPRILPPKVWVDAAAQPKLDPTLDQPGPLNVQTLTYGSGSDLRRPQYAEAVALKTNPIDGSEYLSGWDGTLGWARTQYWGFGPEALPRNARVWYPDGPGPFPLLLIVHGNHSMEVSSEDGYEYLGQFLASHGYILASIDENFLNGSFLDISGITTTEILGENEARGIMLLEHLKLWREWNAAEGNPFFGKVDLDKIALIGHSRGGEAVSTAALFNRLAQHPDNGRDTFDYGFNIRSVIAIAPVDGQYWPTAASPHLDGVNYFVLQGQHDGDIRFNMGVDVYDRVKLEPGTGLVKASINVALANHGQFNRLWGDADISGIWKHLLNRGTLLPAEEQESIARATIRAFLDMTLKQDPDRRPLFERPFALAPWSPSSPALVQFATAEDQTLANFDEDIDLNTGTSPTTRIATEGLAAWKEERIKNRLAKRTNNAAVVAWTKPADDATPKPSYALSLAAPITGLTGESRLLLDVAPHPAPENLDVEEGISLKRDDNDPMDFTIELSDTNGNIATTTLSAQAPLLPLQEIRHWKRIVRDNMSLVESAFQTYAIPLNRFTPAGAQIDLSALANVRLRFDKSNSGAVYLDNVGVRN